MISLYPHTNEHPLQPTLRVEVDGNLPATASPASPSTKNNVSEEEKKVEAEIEESKTSTSEIEDEKEPDWEPMLKNSEASRVRLGLQNVPSDDEEDTEEVDEKGNKITVIPVIVEDENSLNSGTVPNVLTGIGNPSAEISMEQEPDTCALLETSLLNDSSSVCQDAITITNKNCRSAKPTETKVMKVGLKRKRCFEKDDIGEGAAKKTKHSDDVEMMSSLMMKLEDTVHPGC